jgi:hypothetical protein
MSENIEFSLSRISEVGVATLGIDAFFTIIMLAMVGIGYYHIKDEYGARNIAVIPVIITISMIIFSVMIPVITSILFWVLGMFLAGGSILWKAGFKRRGEY